MKKLWILLQNLSLEITAGAIICSLFVAKVFEVSLTPSMLIGLGIAIWLIYAIDHLFDARSTKSISTNPRHAFHQRNFNLLTRVVVLVFLAGLINIYFLPWATIRLGLLLAFLVAIYLGSLHVLKLEKKWHKELLAALIYSFGVFTAPLSLLQYFSWQEGYFCLQFFVLVLSNLLLFPLFEHDVDVKDGHQSIATLKGKRRIKRVAWAAVLLNFILITTGMLVLNETTVIPGWLQAQYVLLLMNGVLFFMLKEERFFQAKQRYRLFGDGIFLLPLIYILL